jgi:hypothetical protein
MIGSIMATPEDQGKIYQINNAMAHRQKASPLPG